MYSRGLSALAFTADFPPAAPKFHQRTHRVRLRNLGAADKKSSRKIKRRKTPRVHKKTAGGKINGGNFNSAAFRRTDEYSGRFQHRGDETDEYMAGGRLGADQCVCRLSCGMVHHREGAHRGSVPRKAVVSAARRGNWRVYHDHGYLEYGRARPGEGGDADRHFPARSGVAD